MLALVDCCSSAAKRICRSVYPKPIPWIVEAPQDGDDGWYNDIAVLCRLGNTKLHVKSSHEIKINVIMIENTTRLKTSRICRDLSRDTLAAQPSYADSPSTGIVSRDDVELSKDSPISSCCLLAQGIEFSLINGFVSRSENTGLTEKTTCNGCRTYIVGETKDRAGNIRIQQKSNVKNHTFRPWGQQYKANIVTLLNLSS
jgi:hypothetical protein